MNAPSHDPLTFVASRNSCPLLRDQGGALFVFEDRPGYRQLSADLERLVVLMGV